MHILLLIPTAVAFLWGILFRETLIPGNLKGFSNTRGDDASDKKDVLGHEDELNCDK